MRVVHTDLLLHLKLIIDGIIDGMVWINLIDPIEFALILNMAGIYIISFRLHIAKIILLLTIALDSLTLLTSNLTLVQPLD